MNEKPVLKRKITKYLEEWADSDVEECLVIGGAIHIGKSFIIEEFLKSGFKNHLIIDFYLKPELKSVFSGNLDIDTILANLNLEFPEFEFIPGETAIFLDEIQIRPNASTALKSFVKDGRFTLIASGLLWKSIIQKYHHTL